MAVHDDLLEFVREGLARGVTRADLESALRSAGWPAPAVAGAMGSYADAGLPLPVPRPRPSLEARDAFLDLVMFATLYVAAFNLGSLLFDLINYWMPDPAVSSASSVYLGYAIRWSASAMIVSTPVFLFIAMLTGREVRRDPAKRASKVRRWTTYLTLFIASTTLIGDVTALVYNLLGGELTTRFLLKIAVVAVIASTAFVYYLSSLRADEQGAAS
jgi:hypothetical protein